MKTALITGSEGQLGQCFIKRLLALNYSVIAFDIAEVSTTSGVDYFKVDITQYNEIKLALNGIDTIDVLINNAGVSVFSPSEDRTEEELDYVINVNIKGTLFMIQTVYQKFFKLQILTV